MTARDLQEHRTAGTMLSSPAKRRKTSPSTSVNVNGSNTDLNQPKPTNPPRASYLSPTKASLARSHPHLAQQNQRRSLTEPRGRKLKDDLLKAKGTSQASNALSGPNAETITNAQEPGKLGDTAPATLPPNSTLVAPRTEPRQPLQSRQPSIRHPATARDFIQAPIVPKLIRRFEGTTPAREKSPPDRIRPRLPPTPVELGWQEPPERPKGLSSSSPRGSRSGSGSGRHRRRLREGQTVTSSPLKPKDRRPMAERIHDQESEAEMAAEEPQSNHAAQAVDNAEHLPNEITDKKMTLESLKADLVALRKSSVALERVLNSNEFEPEMLDDSDALSQIKASLGKKSSFNARFEQLITSEKEAAKYLQLFAPANLQLTSNTTTKLVKGQPKVVHHLIVTAPPPWAPHDFSASFDVITNSESATVENIIWMDTLPGKSQSVGITNELFDWLDTSMKSELHGCNVGNIIWALGQYFEKALQRAKTLSKLSTKYKTTKIGDSSDYEVEDYAAIEDGRPLGEEQALILTKYLTKCQMTVYLPTTEEEVGPRTRRVKKAEPKIMINWRIGLAWNAAVKDVCEIIPSGIPDGAMQSVKDLFQKLQVVQGFEKAFDAVYDLVKGEMEASPAPGAIESRQGSEAPGAKAKGRKRKRFT